MTENGRHGHRGWSVRLFRRHGLTIILRGPAGWYFHQRRRFTNGNVTTLGAPPAIVDHLGIGAPTQPRVERRGWTLSLGLLEVRYAK